MADDKRKGPDLDWLLAVWHRRKWLAIVAFVAAFSAAVTLTMFLPDLYQSTATVLVVGQQVPVEFVRSTVTGAIDSRLQTISQEILSRSRLEELVVRYGLYPEMKDSPGDARVARMRRDLEVKPTGLDRTGGTIAFAIKYQGKDPGTVARVTNTLASSYIEENMKVRERQAVGTAQFLRTQLEDVKKRLEVQEQRVSEFRRRNLGELPSQMDANLQSLERFNSQFRINSEKQIRAREQRQEFARMLDSMMLLGGLASQAPQPAPGPSSASASAPAAPTVAVVAVDPAVMRLNKLKQDLVELRTRFNEQYPDVKQLKAEIASLERQIADNKRQNAAREAAAPEATTQEAAAPARPAQKPMNDQSAQPDQLNVVDPFLIQLQQSLSQVDAELRSLKEEEKNLRASMAAYQARVENTPKRDLEFQELSRDYDSTKELYRTLLKRYEEAQLSESLEQRQKGEQFRILEEAVTPTVPFSPNRARLLVVGLVVALMLSGGLVGLREQLDTSFHAIEDLRAFTNVPVLVGIPRIVTATDMRRRRWRIQLTAVAATVGVMLIVGASYFVARWNEHLLRLLTPGQS